MDGGIRSGQGRAARLGAWSEGHHDRPRHGLRPGAFGEAGVTKAPQIIHKELT